MSEASFHLDAWLPGYKAVHDEGDVIIEGYAADFNRDRENEFFVPGAFERAVEGAKGAPLLYHHDPSHSLGNIEDLQLRDDGLWIKARVAKATAPRDVDIVDKIKRGIIRGLSVGGRMKKNPNGMIDSIDLREISVTPLPVNPRTLFAVAQKAFAAEDDDDCGCQDAKKAEEVREWFEEQLAATEDALDALEGKAFGSAEQRRKWAAQGVAMKDGSFPITHCGNKPGGVGAAKSDLGRTSKPRSAVMAHIRKRAKALGCPDKAKLQSEQS